MITSKFPPDKAIPVLEKLVQDAEELFKEHRYSAARREWKNTTEAALQRALGVTNPATLAFSGAENGFYSSYDSEGELQERADQSLRDRIAAVKSGIQQLRWELPDQTQIFLPAGSEHDAYVGIRKILELVSDSVTIVDTWVDGTVWGLLTNVPASAEIRILTLQMKGDFALEGRKFVAQHGSRVKIRTTKTYHDRFILVNGAKCWHLGASIKDAGNKAFALSEFLSPSIVSAIRTDVENAWNTGTIVPL